MDAETKGYDKGLPPAYNQPQAGGYTPQPAGSYQVNTSGAYPPQPTGVYQGQPVGYGQPPQTTVVFTQPIATTTIVSVARPADYLVPSIFACLCCFWPTGLAAIFFAIQANSQAGRGNMSAAQSSATTARLLMITSVVIGIVWIGLVLILVASGSLVASTHYSYRY